ncbi:MAG: diguanylate cyclase [Clostridia bacterium]|nr:diguanylate cyclase [Clostridia bacterium]
MKQKKLSLTTRYVLMVGLLLMAANLLLGVVILRQSKSAMRALIDKNMLDVANAAADMLDGDVLGALTAEDVDGEIFRDIARKLTIFLNKADIHFIYTVKQSSEGVYTFIVDPDPVDPGAFGEDIVVTEAVIRAGQGVAAVDSEPAADRWGNFYSAYSPVFDSAGKVAGIVGIDFDADWYQQEIRENTMYITIFTVVTVLLGGLVVFLITHRVRKRFAELTGELTSLSSSMEELMREVGLPTERSEDQAAEASEDELERLGSKINAMQREMGLYLDHIHRQAYTDALTKVGNSTAYHERVRAIDGDIAAGRAAFSVALFDVNSLKEINDNLGHEYGDMVIVGAADAIAGAFGAQSTYRIGGDEFAVVKDGVEDSEMAAVDRAISEFNAADTGVRLSLSKGASHYRPGVDAAFKDVFARADQAMYKDKKEYYETIGNRRVRRTQEVK